MLHILAHIDNNTDSVSLDQLMGGEHWPSNGGFTMFWMFIIMLVITVGVIYLLVNTGKEKNYTKNEDPLAVAKSRYAKGEITKKQFDEIKKDIK